MGEESIDLDAEVARLNATYGSAIAGVADLLCDRHDPQAIACTIIRSDLSASDLTYGEVRERSERLASALSGLGLVAGDRIATLMGKSEAYVISVMAIWRLGAVHVPLFTAFAPPAIEFRLAAADCRVIICDAEQAGKLAHRPNESWIVVVAGATTPGTLRWDDLLAGGKSGFAAACLGGHAPLVQIYTSGTTGTPKGVRIPTRALASFHTYLKYGLDVRSDDTYWNAADPGWAYGLYYAVLAPFACGIRTLLFSAGFSPETTVGILNEFGVTNFAAAPTVYRSLKVSGLRPTRRLRCASSAGEPLTPEVNEWALPAIGVEVHDHYGQTETGMVINNHQHPQLRGTLHSGSMGRSMPGWKAAILRTDCDEPADPEITGRLALDLSASALAWFEGYVDAPESSQGKFAGGGRWYLTGDVARISGDGDFYFASRDDDVIIMAGYRIGPTDVESVILSHPAVAECAVVAAPDEVRGEVLVAVVVLRADYEASEALTAEIQARVKTGFAAHAYPRNVHYVNALPKTPSGKIQRFILRQQLWAQNGRS